MDKDQWEGEMNNLKKKNMKLSQELQLEKQEIQKLIRMKRNKRVVKDLLDEVLISRAQDERTRAETYKWKYLELKGKMSTMTENME